MDSRKTALPAHRSDPAVRSFCRRSLTPRAVLCALLLVLLASVALVGSLARGSPLQAAEMRFFAYVQHGMPLWAGAATFCALSALFVALGLPATPLNVASGFVLGGVVGTCCSLAGLEMGAAAAFLLGRTAMRGWAEEQVRTYKKLDAVARAVGEKGFVLVFLLRLSPVMPFGICCYVLGLTKVTFAVYCLATFLGLLPFTVVWCYLGTIIPDLSLIFDKRSATPNPLSSGWITMATAFSGVITTALVVAFTTWITKRALSKVISGNKDSAEVPIVNEPPCASITEMHPDESAKPNTLILHSKVK